MSSDDDHLVITSGKLPGPLTLVCSIISKANPTTERKERLVPGIQLTTLRAYYTKDFHIMQMTSGLWRNPIHFK